MSKDKEAGRKVVRFEFDLGETPEEAEEREKRLDDAELGVDEFLGVAKGVTEETGTRKTGYVDARKNLRIAELKKEITSRADRLVPIRVTEEIEELGLAPFARAEQQRSQALYEWRRLMFSPGENEAEDALAEDFENQAYLQAMYEETDIVI